MNLKNVFYQKMNILPNEILLYIAKLDIRIFYKLSLISKMWKQEFEKYIEGKETEVINKILVNKYIGEKNVLIPPIEKTFFYNWLRQQSGFSSVLCVNESRVDKLKYKIKKLSQIAIDEATYITRITKFNTKMIPYTFWKYFDCMDLIIDNMPEVDYYDEYLYEIRIGNIQSNNIRNIQLNDVRGHEILLAELKDIQMFKAVNNLKILQVKKAKFNVHASQIFLKNNLSWIKNRPTIICRSLYHETINSIFVMDKNKAENFLEVHRKHFPERKFDYKINFISFYNTIITDFMFSPEEEKKKCYTEFGFS